MSHNEFFTASSMKKTAPLLFLFFFALSAPVSAGENFGIGAFFGFYPDAGNLSSRPGIQLRPQNNLIAGILVKLDSDPIFYQLGVYRTFLANRGEVLNDSYGELKETNIQCTAIPGYFGLLLPVKKIGKMYIGTGGALMIASGEIKTGQSEKFSSIIVGLGFKAGIQVNAGENLKFFTEWEYLIAWTRPVAETASATGQKDYSADYSGSRYYLGMMYYL